MENDVEKDRQGKTRRKDQVEEQASDYGKECWKEKTSTILPNFWKKYSDSPRDKMGKNAYGGAYRGEQALPVPAATDACVS